jgi:electron transfer flavoprotein alpha subunit
VNPLPATSLALVVARGERLPAGASEAVAEAGGDALVLGGRALPPGASRVWWSAAVPPYETLAPLLSNAGMLVLPASPDGRDMAPGLSATLGWPLLAGAVSCSLSSGEVGASLLRVDGRVTVPASAPAPAVVTLWPGSGKGVSAGGAPSLTELDLPASPPSSVSLVKMVEPDPATMDLSEARRVLGGGAGLVPSGATDEQAGEWFSLLVDVAAALGASAGATRVVTDAGWADHNRQIGTTGVAVDPDLYVALGVSGASQHVGGLGSPDHTISVNIDPSCPMTAMAELGLVSDAPGVLVELARRLGVKVPPELEVAL